MIKIFLCDDNEAMIKVYSKLIRTVAKNNNIPIKISTFASGELLLARLSFSNEMPDIIYLDILMNLMNGIDTAKKIREMNIQAEIIFLTTSEDYVFDAFDVRPIHYLLKKDISYDKFEEVFLQAEKTIKKRIGEQFIIQAGKSHLIIFLDSIRYFEIYRRMITVHYDDKTYQYYSSFKELETKVQEKNFIRIHRSYIVNLIYIIDFQKEKIVLSDGTELPVGVTYYKSVKKAFSDYIYKTSTQII